MSPLSERQTVTLLRLLARDWNPGLTLVVSDGTAVLMRSGDYWGSGPDVIPEKTIESFPGIRADGGAA